MQNLLSLLVMQAISTRIQMVKVERKCSVGIPSDDNLSGASAWKVSPVLAGDQVVISSRPQRAGSTRPYEQSVSSGARVYLRVASDGALQYVSRRSDATVFTILSQTGERDPLRERNEIQLYAEQSRSNDSPIGFVYFVLGDRELRVLGDSPDRAIASRVRLVPSLLTKERLQRQLRKSEPASPFIFTPDDNLDRFTQDEGPIVRYGDVIVFRAPSLEYDNNYQYITCSESNGKCLIVQANQDSDIGDNSQEVVQFFSFQCPDGGLMYARTVPADDNLSSLQMAGSDDILQTDVVVGGTIDGHTATGQQKQVSLDQFLTQQQQQNQQQQQKEQVETQFMQKLENGDEKQPIQDANKQARKAESDGKQQTVVVEDPSDNVIKAVQETENPEVTTDRPDPTTDEPEKQQKEDIPWYEQPLGLAAIAALALAIVAMLVWAIVKVIQSGDSKSSRAQTPSPTIRNNPPEARFTNL